MKLGRERRRTAHGYSRSHDCIQDEVVIPLFP